MTSESKHDPDDFDGGWNYRVVRQRSEGAEVDTYGEWRYGVHEVWYGKGGALNTMTVEEIGVHGNSEEQMHAALKLYAKAFLKPTLTYPDDFPEGKEDPSMVADVTEGLVKVGEVWDRVRNNDPKNLKVGTITVEAIGKDWLIVRADHGEAIFIWFQHMNKTEVKLRLDEYRQPANTETEGENNASSE